MKTAIVTGSTKGIGKAIALKLLEQGCFVILNYASDDKTAQVLSEELSNKYCNQFFIIKATLSSMDSLQTFVHEVQKRIDKIDYLILNAGITDKTSFDEVSYENWQRVMDTNINIPFFTIQKLSLMMTNSSRIICIGSIQGIYPHATSISYGVSKAALHFLAKSLMKVFADRKITINVIAPSFVETPWQKDKSLTHKKRIEDKTALHRFAQPEEIADACMSMLNNGYVNGSIIVIDGGYCYQ